ncbi:hypothetical protein ACO0LD_28545 [Undibacterium sp. Ji83W]|uniref:hypothetical protein n=1 Tax=Undibacterium sp. Ji83W TaxID=3413043 RepID=UPI003BF3C308
MTSAANQLTTKSEAKFEKKGRKIYFSSVLLALCANLFFLPQAHADQTISAMAGPWPITIRTCSYDAGAVCSLTWRGKEFINDYDHGRQLQSASSFDNLGESFNPTEAGAAVPYNGVNPSVSSSILQGEWATSNVLATQTQMAFWNPVGGSQVSNHILNKRITIGLPNMAHVIEYLTQFTIPSNESHSFGVFEALTGYMPPEFSKFYTFDVRNNAVMEAPISDGPGEQNLPIIFATPDGGWAMGIYSPEAPQATFAGLGYGRFRFPDTVKWNNVFRIYNPSGTYHFRSYVIVGSLENVRVSMTQLYNAIH